MTTITFSKAYTIASAIQKLAAIQKVLDVPFDMVAKGAWETFDGEPVFLSPLAKVVRIPSRSAVIALVDGKETSLVMPKELSPRDEKPFIAFRVTG